MMRISLICLLLLLVLPNIAHSQISGLPSSCGVIHLRGGTPSGPAFVGGRLAVTWAGPNSICTPPAGNGQLLLLGQHHLGLLDLGGPCRNAVCSFVDIAPWFAIPPTGSTRAAGWVIPIPPDPTLRGSRVDMQVLAATCVSFLPGTLCFATGRPSRVTIQ